MLVFAGITFLAGKPTILRLGLAKLIILADLLWVLDSAVLLVFFSGFLSPIGFEFLLITAAIVLVLAIGQLMGMASIYQGESDVRVSVEGAVMKITASLAIEAPAERVWQMMSHQESYADVADNLSKVEVLEGRGEGMIRWCYDTKGKSWTESCTLWDDGRAFAFRVHTEADGYPLSHRRAERDLVSVTDRGWHGDQDGLYRAGQGGVHKPPALQGDGGSLCQDR